MRQTQRDGHVADAAVNANGTRALREFLRQGIKRQQRQNDSTAAQLRRNSLAGGQLFGAAVEQRDLATAGDQSLTQVNPILQRPRFVKP